jgi:hypothetical protein
MNFEQANEAIREFAIWASENDERLERNEAQTRFDLIDRILACLGWSSPDVRVETHGAGTYTDYELGRPGARLLIEAKREGTYFTLPAGWTDRIAKISTVSSGSSDIEDAIDQALSYALRRGIQYAAISNGWQIVAFIASRTDAVAPMDGDALIFSSLTEMVADFRTLWDNLSLAGTQEGVLSRTLARRRPQPAIPKLSKKAVNYPGLARRHDDQQTLQILGSVFVEDLAALEENERRFLISCYAPSGALSQYAFVSREILRTRYSLLFDDSAEYTVTPASTHTGLDPNLLGDIAAASLKQRPILLLGDVGVGKSTFVKNLILVEAREQLEQAIVLYLDFGKRPALTQDLTLHVASEIERQLIEGHGIDVHSDGFVRGVYHGRLEGFKSSIFGQLEDTSPESYAEREIEFLATLVSDVDEHLKASLTHISRAHRKQVVIFLDNVDQRDSSFQNQLFVIAQTMAESWPVTVFLALRPETFYESRRSGSLSAYQPRAFTISPPRVEIVLNKRLTYALELLRDGGLRTSSGVEINIDLSTLVLYMETVQRSLQVNPSLMEFLENVSNGNIRDALGYLEMYIGSPHVNLRRMLTVLSEEGPGRYVIPLQDLVKSVLLGDGEYYDPSRSPIGNLFDLTTTSRAEHFILPILIEFLHIQGAQTSADGFVEIAQIYEFGQGLGFSVDVISSAITRGLDARFVTRSGFDRRSGEDGRAYRVAPCGLYATQKLCRTFTYVDAVIDDTPIVDPDFYGTLHPISHRGELNSRLRRAERFLAYLSESWRSLVEAGDMLAFNWNGIAADLSADITRIRDRLRH